MAVQYYQRLSPAALDEIWRRMRAGQSMKPTARALGLPTSTVRSYLVRCGGIRPEPRRRSPSRLGLAEREEISRGLAAGLSLRAIAVGLGRAPSTVSREVAAHGGRRGSKKGPARLMVSGALAGHDRAACLRRDGPIARCLSNTPVADVPTRCARRVHGDGAANASPGDCVGDRPGEPLPYRSRARSSGRVKARL
jgi:DNA-binding CsgD family transcriptional regulator